MSTYYERAAIIPGRSMTRSKAPGRFFPVDSGGPLYAVDGVGPYLIAENGKRYIDMLCGLGAVSLGYRKARHVGPACFSLPHQSEIFAAEAVLEHVAPWASSVRFTKTGSEATHAAYRIARRLTGRHDVWIGDWAYHGWHEWTDASSLKYPHGADVEAFVNGHTAWANFDPTPAAIFIEPHRWEAVDPEWLRSVRAYCTRIGALLVFDEMIYGGRWALGGATEHFGVIPDLACYGKAFGNGQAVAFVVGNEALKEHGELVSGTYSGDAGGLVAVEDTIREYVRENVIATLWARGRQLAAGLDALCAGTPVRREGAPVHQRLTFPEPADGLRFSAEMAKHGVLWHPGVTNIMAAHTEAIIDQVLDAARASLKAVLA
jgi:glutamate-1-semialdehyde aminotransferase